MHDQEAPQRAWEKRVLKELYNEYSSILYNHRIKMKPATIELIDSQIHWGRWNAEARSIEISRRLVREHRWFNVLGVLRHEMAHQLVDETFPEAAQRPHGPEFLRACQRLGVPAQFTRASCDLAESTHDWRSEKRDEHSERLLERVRKLLALATSANEHEALLAMNKVRELYARYNLEQEVKEAGQEFVHLYLGHGKRRFEIHQRMIVGILVGHFFVEAIYNKSFNPESGIHEAVVELIGSRENVLMAEYVYHFLSEQIETQLKLAEVKAGTSLGRVGRKSFRMGLLNGFSEKLRQSEIPQAESPLIYKALVQFQHDPKLRDYLSVVHPRLRSVRSSSYQIDGSIYAEGRSVGATMTLNKPVTSSSGNRGRLLTSS